jgi:hypothetical protein
MVTFRNQTERAGRVRPDREHIQQINPASRRNFPTPLGAESHLRRGVLRFMVPIDDE